MVVRLDTAQAAQKWRAEIRRVWAGIRPADLQHAFGVWWTPQYASLRLEGARANPVPPWDLLAVPASLAVRDAQHVPYCVASQDPELSFVLTQEWPHEHVLAGLP